MKFQIFIAPHERQEAIDAYREYLSDDKITTIEDLEDDSTFIVLTVTDGKAKLVLRP